MSKAILGSFADPRTLELLDEIRALRARVAVLESALEEAEAAASVTTAEDPLVLAMDDSTPESVSA
jgi:hypothetical protein